jgi:hypothetical protein
MCLEALLQNEPNLTRRVTLSEVEWVCLISPVHRTVLILARKEGLVPTNGLVLTNLGRDATVWPVWKGGYGIEL